MSTSRAVCRAIAVIAWCAGGISAAQTPIIDPDAAVMPLDELGFDRIGYAFRGMPEQWFPVGWRGDMDPATGVAAHPVAPQNGMPAFLLHPPWRNGTGVSIQEFVVRMPAGATAIHLRGATALQTDAVGRSDGVLFRITAAGATVLQQTRVDAAWNDFDLDLTAYVAAGTVTIRFETDPGVNDDPSFDFALWGRREFAFTGFAPPPVIPPAPPAVDYAAWRARGDPGAAPIGPPRAIVTERSGDAVVLRSTGPRDAVAYTWNRPVSAADPPLGLISWHGQRTGLAAVDVPIAQDARILWDHPATWTESHWEASGGNWTCVSSYALASGVATLRVTAQAVGSGLTLSVTCDRPEIAALDIGNWGPVLRRRALSIPYYTKSGAIESLPIQGLLVNAFLDWSASQASELNGTHASYDPIAPSLPTAPAHALLSERAVFLAGWDLVSALPNIPDPPSPWREDLGGRIVIDVWGGRYADIASDLERLGAQGITHAMVIVHDWQGQGYDNALPDHLPAAAGYGGDAGLAALSATARRLGMRISVHENYADYYPNYSAFSAADVALESSGSPMLAWFNPTTGLQSFAIKPNAILRLAATQSPEIHRRYATDGCYLDVHSSVPPWFHVDHRAGEPGAATFASVLSAHRDLWA